jgi:hypothetical protein
MSKNVGSSLHTQEEVQHYDLLHNMVCALALSVGARHTYSSFCMLQKIYVIKNSVMEKSIASIFEGRKEKD